MTVPPINSRPGIYVSETLAGPAPAPLTTSPSTAAFMGEHWRGPVGNPILIQNWQQFQQVFGGFNPNTTPVLGNPYLAYSVFGFFANGGSACWVYRLASSVTPGATASLNIKDSQGTPQNTLSLTLGALGVSGNPGTWGNGVYVDVVPNTSVPNTGRFNLIVYNNPNKTGTGAQYVVEQWLDLSMNPTDQRYVLSVINSPTQGSNWVVATNAGDSAAAPYNSPANPIGQLGLQFSGGTDPADPATSDWTNALVYGASPSTGAFDSVGGVLNINLPGQTVTAVVQAAVTYAQTRPYSFLVIDPPDSAGSMTPAGVVSWLETTLQVTSPNSSIYYPWLNTTNPATPNLGNTILLPPGGYVLGEMATTDAAVGPWKAPAGTPAVLTGVVSADRKLSPADQGTVNTNNINLIKTRANGQTVLFGARTLQSGYASMYVPVRRTLNYIEASLVSLLEFALFQPNDLILWSQITATANAFLAGLWGQNAFPGNASNQAYYVTCNSSNNTQASIAQGTVNCTVGVALLYPAEFIDLNIAQFQPSGTTLVSEQAA